MTSKALLSLLLALGAFAAVSEAEAAGGKAIAVHVEGPEAAVVRAQVLASLPQGVEIADADAFGRALSSAGQKGPMGDLLLLPKARDKMLERIRGAASDQHLAGALVGRVRKARSGFLEIHLVYLPASRKDLAIDRAASLRGAEAQRVAAIKTLVANAVEAPEPEAHRPAEALPAPRPADEERPPPREIERDPTDVAPERVSPQEAPSGSGFQPNHVGTAVFVIDAAFQLGGRSFAYTRSEVDSSNLRDYQIPATPQFAASAGLYPLATTKVALVKDLGLVGSYDQGFGAKSVDGKGHTFDSSTYRGTGGLRFRARTGGPDSPTFGVSGAVGVLHFGFEPVGQGAQSLASEVASVDYTYIRPGLDARFTFGRFALSLGGGYLGVIEAGEVDARFTSQNPGTKGRSRVAGVDGTVGFSWRMVAGLEARLAAEYTRFFYAFSPDPSDPYIAGGALDQFFGARLGAAYAY